MSNWQDTLKKSTQILDRSTAARKQASNLLWTGAQEAIEEWLPTSDTDVSAEGLRSDVLDALGTSRKGDASKIVTVALATNEHGLVLSQYPNLSKAYAEAVRLTKTVKTHAAEDEAAEEAVANIAAPKTTSKPEGAALLVLSKGVDEAARLLLDALGADNTAAHRSLLRAISQEIAGRVKPAPKPKKAASAKPKAVKKATAAPKTAKAKPAPAKAKPVKKAVEPVENEDMFDLVDDADVEVAEAPKAPVRRAQPVKRAAVKRPARV